MHAFGEFTSPVTEGYISPRENCKEGEEFRGFGYVEGVTTSARLWPWKVGVQVPTLTPHMNGRRT